MRLTITIDSGAFVPRDLLYSNKQNSFNYVFLFREYTSTDPDPT